jgi:fermentation-respiration switch protein FrsA (DUF1100 family)
MPEFCYATYEYTGYGPKSLIGPGEHPSEKACVSNAAHVAHHAARTRDLPLVFYGRSLGSHMGITAALDAGDATAALVLESPPLSCISTYVNTPLIRWRPLDYFVNTRVLARLNVPLLVIHGTADNLVPFEHGKHLFNVYHHIKDRLWVRDGGHNNLHDPDGQFHHDIMQKVREFLHQHVNPVEP